MRSRQTFLPLEPHLEKPLGWNPREANGWLCAVAELSNCRRRPPAVWDRTLPSATTASRKLKHSPFWMGTYELPTMPRTPRGSLRTTVYRYPTLHRLAGRPPSPNRLESFLFHKLQDFHELCRVLARLFAFQEFYFPSDADSMTTCEGVHATVSS